MVDVLVVGARCAGATLAIHLARAGKRVLVVDRCAMPSDQPMSTHLITAHGMALLDDLGLGDKVRAFATPIPLLINGVSGAVARIALPPGRQASCPRRYDLDALLVSEARAAGAEFRLRTKLVGLLRDGDRVVGGVVEHQGRREEIRAAVLVGADGRNSTVAEAVAADEYLGYDSPRASYWAYWPRPAWYEEDPRYQGGAVILHDADDYLFIFPAGNDQLLVGVALPVERLPEWRGRHRARLLERVRGFPGTAPVTEGEPSSEVAGMIKARFFFRRAAGRGWALVGDAGLFKDPAAALGITDAFRDARALARSIVSGGDEALIGYWRARDECSIELFHFARDLGEPGYNNPFNRVVFSKLAAHAHLRDRVVAVQARELSPFEVFSAGKLVGWVAAAFFRGSFGVIRPFLAVARRAGASRKELRLRRRLARAVRAKETPRS